MRARMTFGESIFLAVAGGVLTPRVRRMVAGQATAAQTFGGRGGRFARLVGRNRCHRRARPFLLKLKNGPASRNRLRPARPTQAGGGDPSWRASALICLKESQASGD